VEVLGGFYTLPISRVPSAVTAPPPPTPGGLPRSYHRQATPCATQRPARGVIEVLCRLSLAAAAHAPDPRGPHWKLPASPCIAVPVKTHKGTGSISRGGLRGTWAAGGELLIVPVYLWSLDGGTVDTAGISPPRTPRGRTTPPCHFLHMPSLSASSHTRRTLLEGYTDRNLAPAPRYASSQTRRGKGS